MGIEIDKEVLEIAQKRVSKTKVKLVHANFRNIDKVARDNGFLDVDGILLDLGVNTIQLTSKDRGMSFSNPRAKLDMRLDPSTQDIKACDLLNGLREEQLMRVFGRVMEYKEAKGVTKKVLDFRKIRKIIKVGDLLVIVGKPKGKCDTHPATKTFLALRIAVNSELENLAECLPKAFELLKSGGRLLVISFHSGEDQIVKNYFKSLSDNNSAKILTKKPVVPQEDEILKNKKSRSAKLRAMEKI